MGPVVRHLEEVCSADWSYSRGPPRWVFGRPCSDDDAVLIDRIHQSIKWFFHHLSFLSFFIYLFFFFVSSIESFRKKANKQQRIKCATFAHSYLRRRFPRLNNYSVIIRWIGRKLRLGSIFGCISCRMLCAVVPWMINHALNYKLFSHIVNLRG